MSVVASRFPSSNNQLKTSFNLRNQATIQDGKVIVQQVQGRQIQSFYGTRNIGIATNLRGTNTAGQPRVVKCYNYQGEGHMILDEEQLEFIADPVIEEAPFAQQKILQNAAFQTKDLNAYDSNGDDLSSAKAVLMVNLSSCDSDVLSEIKPTLYDRSVIAKEHVVIYMTDDEETLILEEESRSKMLVKQNDPISIEKKANIALIDYSKLNNLKEDFGKCFVTQQELSAEQAFWLKHSSISETPVKSHTPVRVEAPSELPKVSIVNESLEKIIQLANFDKVVKKRLTPDAITAGSWGFEHIK
nr:hypothetical protein [Tanacetum cinerariifolium]